MRVITSTPSVDKIILASLFVFPICLLLLSQWYWHFVRDQVSPAVAIATNSKNNGELIQPPLKTQLIETKDTINKQWLLVSAAKANDSNLDSIDPKKLRMFSNIKSALGKYQADVRYLWLNQQQQVMLPKAMFYLVDPDGYLILSYQADSDIKGIYQDLKFLLKKNQHRIK